MRNERIDESARIGTVDIYIDLIPSVVFTGHIQRPILLVPAPVEEVEFEFARVHRRSKTVIVRYIEYS